MLEHLWLAFTHSAIVSSYHPVTLVSFEQNVIDRPEKDGSDAELGAKTYQI